MTSTRDTIREAASDLGWVALDNIDRYVDIYRTEPYSVMVHFTRDGMVIDASLFTDAPDARQKLPPRIVRSVGKFDANKQRRIRSWLYDFKRAATA